MRPPFRMKQQIAENLVIVVKTLKTDGLLPENFQPRIGVENTKDKVNGDFATNLAMMLTKQIGKPPREVAEEIIKRFPATDFIKSIAIAGPGFINFSVKDKAKFEVVKAVIDAGTQYGKSQAGSGKKVLVEFVSANPTGPLHVGHGRGAAYGASVASLLSVAGFEVSSEYYVNDAGRQMDILATSVWLRYLELCGQEVAFPSNGYKGDYVFDIASNLIEEYSSNLSHPIKRVFDGVVQDFDAKTETGDKESHIDDLILKAKGLLGEENYSYVFDAALNVILSDIKQDLSGFGVEFNEWFSERSLMDSGVIDLAIKKLQKADKIYEKEGALWFRSTDYGDEKDRVVVRDNGLKTYFASDIAYHLNKLERGFDTLINIWGSDHHGYVPRVKAAMEAMGEDTNALEVLLVQFAILYQGGKKLSMSTRSGQFVTLRELREEVGVDAARFFYVQRKSEQHMDFDLDLAKSKSNENPVYYIQYAHARICRVMAQTTEKGFSFDLNAGLNNLQHLALEQEADLALLVSKYPDIVARAALAYEPHQIAYYLKDLAHGLHSYYNATQFIVPEDNVRNARLSLIVAVKQVLKNGLAILGVSAPEKM